VRFVTAGCGHDELTTAAWRPARFHDGRYCEALLPLSDASTIRGNDTSLVECSPRPSVTALRSVSTHNYDAFPTWYARLLRNDELVQLGRAVLVIPLMPKDSGQSLLDKLLSDVADGIISDRKFSKWSPAGTYVF
jgi:hypothetical protein